MRRGTPDASSPGCSTSTTRGPRPSARTSTSRPAHPGPWTPRWRQHVRPVALPGCTSRSTAVSAARAHRTASGRRSSSTPRGRRPTGHVRVVGVWSHLAYADAPGHPTTDAQVETFREAIALVEAEGLEPEVRHLANSAATLTRPDAHFDLVRPGIAVYGISPMPDDHPSDTLGLRPAMTLTARAALVKRLPAGHGVSYLHRYRTTAETTTVLVPLGYADGIPRNATNVGPVLAAGARRTIAGTVCMDQFVVDVGDDPVSAGDEVVLFGPGDSGEPTVDDWARATGTISYEIVTRIGPRVPRTYVGGAG